MSIRGTFAVLFVLLLQWEYGSAQSYSYYFRPGPGADGSFNIGNPQQQFTGFPSQPQLPFSGGTPPPGAQFYQYSLPGGNDEPQQPRAIQQPIQYYQPQQQGHRQQQQQQQPTVQYVPQHQAQIQPFALQQQQPQPLRFTQSVTPQQQQLTSLPSQSPTAIQQTQTTQILQQSEDPRVTQQIDEPPSVTQVPFEIRQFYINQPTYSPLTLNNIGNILNTRAEAINNPKGGVDIKESSEKTTVESKDNDTTVSATPATRSFPAKTISLSVTHVRNVEVNDDSSDEDEDTTPVPRRGFPRVTSTAAAVTPRSRSTTTTTTVRTTTPEEVPVTTEQTRATINDDQFIKPNPSSESDSADRNPFVPSQFQSPGRVENTRPFLPNQFSPQTQQFLPSHFTTRDPESQFLPNQFPTHNSQFSPNHFSPQNQFFPHQQQFPPQFRGPQDYFQNQYPSPDPPRTVQVSGGRQEEGFTFRPFPSEIPEIDNNSGEIEDEPRPFVSSTIPPEPTPSPIPETTTSTGTTRSSGRNGKSYYKFVTPSGLYNTGTVIPLQQYSAVGIGETTEEQTTGPVRKGRKRIRVNRNRSRQRPVELEQPAIIPENQFEPIVSQVPVYANSVTVAPEDDVTTYRSKFRFVSRQSTTTRRPIREQSYNNEQIANNNEQIFNNNEQTSNTEDSAQDAINRRLQTLQRQIRFKTSNKNQDRKSG